MTALAGDMFEDAGGHVIHESEVIEMIEAGKPCLEIAQQMQAVEKAVTNAKRALIHDHMDHCIDVESSETDRAELRAIARYL